MSDPKQNQMDQKRPKLKKVLEDIVNYLFDEEDADSEEDSNVPDPKLRSLVFNNNDTVCFFCGHAEENEGLKKKLKNYESKIKVQKTFLEDLITSFRNEIERVQGDGWSFTSDQDENSETEQETPISLYKEGETSKCDKCGNDFTVYNGDQNFSYDMHIQSEQHTLAVYKPLARANFHPTQDESHATVNKPSTPATVGKTAPLTTSSKNTPTGIFSIQNEVSKQTRSAKDKDGNSDVKITSGDAALDTVTSIICAPIFNVGVQMEQNRSNSKLYHCCVCTDSINVQHAVNCIQHLTGAYHLSEMWKDLTLTPKVICMEELLHRYQNCEAKLQTSNKSISQNLRFKRLLVLDSLKRAKRSILNNEDYKKALLKGTGTNKNVNKVSNNEKHAQKSACIAEETEDVDVNRTLKTFLRFQELFILESNRFKCKVCKTFCPTGPMNLITHLVGKAHLKKLCKGLNVDQRQTTLKGLYIRLVECEKELSRIDSKKARPNKSLLVKGTLSSLSKSKKSLKSQLLSETVEINSKEKTDIHKKVDLGASTSKDCRIENSVHSKTLHPTFSFTEPKSVNVTFTNVLTNGLIYSSKEIDVLSDISDDKYLQEQMISFLSTSVYIDGRVVSCLYCKFSSYGPSLPGISLLRHLISFDHMIIICKRWNLLQNKQSYVTEFCNNLERVCQNLAIRQYLRNCNAYENALKFINDCRNDVELLKKFEIEFWSTVSAFKNIQQYMFYQVRDTMTTLKHICSSAYIDQFDWLDVFASICNSNFLNMRLKLSELPLKLFYKEKEWMLVYLDEAINKTKIKSGELYSRELQRSWKSRNEEISGCTVM